MNHTTLREVKISVSDLAIGMHVSRLDKEWKNSPFLFQGFLIDNEKLIKQLQAECNEVYIDTIKGEAYTESEVWIKKIAKEKGFFKKITDYFHLKFSQKPNDKKDHTHKKSPSNYQKPHKLNDILDRKVLTKTIIPPKPLHTFNKELKSAKQTHHKTTEVVKNMMHNARNNKQVDVYEAEDSIHDCMLSVLRSPDAMMLMTNLKTKHKTIWQESMNLSVLAITFGRYLNLEKPELVKLGLCGMLANIGRLRVTEDDIKHAKNKKELAKLHATLSYQILSESSGELNKIVAEVAYSFHERLDGTGFPRRLKEKDISPYARMISIVSTYNNLTTDRVHKKGMTHYDAMTVIRKKVDTCFDEDLVNSFNQCIGAYPVGSIVEMYTGEIALVVEVNPNHKLRPKVVLLTYPNKKKCPQKIIDLGKTNAKDTINDDSLTIRGIVRAETYGIDFSFPH